MKKILTLFTIAPLAITACGASEVSRDTSLGEDVEYIKIGKDETGTVSFNKNDFYQAARDYGWSYVKSWFNQEIAKYDAINLNIEEENEDGSTNRTYEVNNGLAYYDMFNATAATAVQGELCEGIDIGTYCHDAAIHMIAQEILWEEFQTYEIQNEASKQYSFALSLALTSAGHKIYISDVENFEADLYGTPVNGGTPPTEFKDRFLWAADRNLKGYYEETTLNIAGEVILTINYLMEQETITKISGSNYYKPSTRLGDIYSDNKPTIWNSFTFESKKISNVTEALQSVVWTDVLDSNGDVTTPANTVDEVLAISDAVPTTDDLEYKYHMFGMGHNSAYYNAPADVRNIAHSNNSKYRKESWINTGTTDEPKYIHEITEETFAAFYIQPIDLDDYKHESGAKTGMLMPDNTKSATHIDETERLYAYFLLSQVGSINTFATNYYYSAWNLKAFDETIYNNLSDILDN